MKLLLFLGTVILLFNVGCSARYQPSPALLQKPEPRRLDYLDGKEPFLEVTWFGNANLWITDKEHAVMNDGWVSRFGALRLMLWKIGSKPVELNAAAETLGKVLDPLSMQNLELITVGHTHYDHVLDAPSWQKHTLFGKSAGSIPLAGPPNLRPYALASEVKEKWIYTSTGTPAILVDANSKPLVVPGFSIAALPMDHGQGKGLIQCLLRKWLHGDINEHIKPSAHFSRFNIEHVLAYYLVHDATNTRLMIYGSAGLPRTDLSKYPVDVLYLCLGLFADLGEEQMEKFYEEVIVATKVRTVVPIHWDSLFKEPGNNPVAMKDQTTNITAAMKFLTEKSAGKNAPHGFKIVWPEMWQPMRVDK